MEVLAEGISGAVGGLFGRTVAFPFDTLRVKLSTSEAGIGLRKVVRRMLEKEGICGLYRGLPFSALDVTSQKFLYVLFFAVFKQTYRKIANNDPATLISLICGYFADLASTPFTMPIEATVVQLQSAPAHVSKTAIIRKTLLSYEGLVGATVKAGSLHFILAWKPAFEFGIFDSIKNMILQARAVHNQKSELTPFTAFVLGAVARGIATTLIYPFNHGKALMQAELAATPYSGLGQILRTEGVLAIYRGLGLELMRGMTQSALMFMMMEQVREKIRQMILQLGKGTKR